MPGTLAEVGATRLTRRPAAAAQAGLFALLGMVLVGQVVVAPLIAAAIAGVSIRRHPTVTRRLT
jgi:hypothetical protein